MGGGINCSLLSLVHNPAANICLQFYCLYVSKAEPVRVLSPASNQFYHSKSIIEY